jgi:hypothetical protein
MCFFLPHHFLFQQSYDQHVPVLHVLLSLLLLLLITFFLPAA